MITKSYVFHCSKKKIKLNIYHLQTRIKTTFETLDFISKKNNEQDKFSRNWNTFKTLFDQKFDLNFKTKVKKMFRKRKRNPQPIYIYF